MEFCNEANKWTRMASICLRLFYFWCLMSHDQIGHWYNKMQENFMNLILNCYIFDLHTLTAAQIAQTASAMPCPHNQMVGPSDQQQQSYLGFRRQTETGNYYNILNRQQRDSQVRRILNWFHQSWHSNCSDLWMAAKVECWRWWSRDQREWKSIARILPAAAAKAALSTSRYHGTMNPFLLTIDRVWTLWIT